MRRNDPTAVVVQLDRNLLRDLQQVFYLEVLPQSPVLADLVEVDRDLSDFDATELSRLVAGAISLGGSYARILLASVFDESDEMDDLSDEADS